jgi:hypothetical protein
VKGREALCLEEDREVNKNRRILKRLFGRRQGSKKPHFQITRNKALADRRWQP